MDRERREDGARAWIAGNLQRSVRASSDPDVRVYAGGQPQRMSPYEFARLVRKLKIFRWLERLEFGSFLDLASGFEHIPYLVTERYSVPAYYADMVHQFNLPIDGLFYGKLDHAVTLQLPVLPYRDDAFDVVLCSEVFEHLVRPIEAIAEMMRVARKYVVLTTLEGLAVNRWRRILSHWHVDVRVPHVERNFLVLDEFAALFGDGWQHESLLYSPNFPASLVEAVTDQAPAYDALDDTDALVAALCRAVSEGRHGPGSLGVVVVKPKAGALVRPPRIQVDAELARWLVAKAAFEEEWTQTALGIWAALERNPALRPKDPAPDRPVAPALLALLRCPDCGGPLDGAGTGARCGVCGQTFPGDWGVPILYSSRPADGALTDKALSRLCGDSRRRRRVVRRIARRLRRNERAPGPVRKLAWRLLPSPNAP